MSDRPTRRRFGELVLLALVVLLAAFLAGCGGNLPPDFADHALCLASCDGTCERQDSGRWRCVPDSPPPSPCGEEGCPTGEVCVDGECEDPAPPCLPGVPWCHETDPPQTCSTDESPCQHNPSSDPDHCELAQACDEPPPPDDGLPCPQRPGDEGWHVVEPKPKAPDSKLVAVAQSIDTLKLEQPERFTQAGTRLANWDGGGVADEFFHEVALILARTAECAGQCREASGKLVDCLMVKATPTDWMELHLIHYLNGDLLSVRNAYKHMYRDELAGPAPPPPGQCGDPHPPALSHFRGPAEKVCGPGQCCDSTPYVCDDDGTYCRSVGFTDGRRCCAVRTEGAADRKACELMILGGAAVWTSDGAAELCNDNHLRGTCPDGCTWLQVCDASGAVCNRKDF